MCGSLTGPARLWLCPYVGFLQEASVRVSFKKDASFQHLQVVTASQGAETGKRPKPQAPLSPSQAPRAENRRRVRARRRGNNSIPLKSNFQTASGGLVLGGGVIAPVAAAAARLAGGAASPETALSRDVTSHLQGPGPPWPGLEPSRGRGTDREESPVLTHGTGEGTPNAHTVGIPTVPRLFSALRPCCPGRRLWQEGPQGQSSGERDLPS